MAATSQQSPSIPCFTSKRLAPPVNSCGLLTNSCVGREERDKEGGGGGGGEQEVGKESVRVVKKERVHEQVSQ